LAHWPAGPDLDSGIIRVTNRPAKIQVHYKPYPFDPRVYPHLASPLYLQRTDSRRRRRGDGKPLTPPQQAPPTPFPAIIQAILLPLRELSPAAQLAGRRNAAGSLSAAKTQREARRSPERSGQLAGRRNAAGSSPAAGTQRAARRPPERSWQLAGRRNAAGSSPASVCS
jgi:hypothetical protein